MPRLEQFEIKKYWQIFSGLKPEDNKVSHDQVLPVLYNSKLDSSVLNQIWSLADIDEDDQLDFEEFVICMRLVFDLVNKRTESPPEELPDWLIPGSKAKMVGERRLRHQQENADLPRHQVPRVDWYMSPEDISYYDKLLESATRASDGTYTLQALELALRSHLVNLGHSDFERVWKLVNPRNLDSIDRDPVHLFIHCLRQHNDVGALIPSELPRALADVCNKQTIQYDLNSNQAQVRRTTSPSKSNSAPQTNQDTPKRSLTTQNTQTKVSTEFAQSFATVGDAELERIRLQFQELLNYYEMQVKQDSNNGVPLNLKAIKDDIGNIEEQFQLLESFLNSRREKLHDIRTEIQSLQ